MIQIDMEKPKGCNVCPFAVPHKKLLGFYVCLVNGNKFGQLTSGLYDWYEDRYFLECPLKELKGADDENDNN